MRTSLDEIHSQVEHLRESGWTVMLSRPDRHYRLQAWRSDLPEALHMYGSREQVYLFLRAIILLAG